MTDEQRAAKPKPIGRWIEGGPGRPPRGKGESKAKPQVSSHISIRVL